MYKCLGVGGEPNSMDVCFSCVYVCVCGKSKRESFVLKKKTIKYSCSNEKVSPIYEKWW